MENFQTQAQLFKVLMHPTRLAILDVLREEEQCVCHMEALFGLRQAHTSQHLMVLREAGLVTDRREGWNIFYRVVRPEIYPILDAMDAFVATKSDIKKRHASQKKKATACPCPKCSPGSGAASPQSLVIPLESVEHKA